MKENLVCEEQINGCDYYSIRNVNDCCPSRFRVLASFDTYKEADDYINYLRHPEDYFDKDEN